ncbi:leucine/isoleucine/valine transporter subunit; ATP-binding component of ABC superfamily [Candidatus Defluviicoccus seviourii]|uniref:Leucine/isoleucine/valine transporter subunit ATP-binding component of ABC superfamily n=1 Tax=Candidatus Defluviicoccus seviourii TaxID=2565273 RepID=A0A564WF77_9PROT|nr:leucine/isoleucine/valine transporter subunit; ATP-binding component of ABC superfamily [Candidatus Defluviicoccus seviourii]
MAMLELHQVETFYGLSQALFGVELTIEGGEVVTLMGRNGMGKTTTLRTIMGLQPPRHGTVRFRDRDVTGWPSHRIARLGIGYVPEGRHVFANLTVRENLLATAANHAGTLEPWTVERVMSLFPRLAERHQQFARTLSGGEQQMLAIGRALMTNPVFMIFDEATEGLAPLIREEIWTVLETNLREAGQAILVIDKHPEAMARIADRHYVMEKGRIVWSGNSAALLADQAMQERFLGV